MAHIGAANFGYVLCVILLIVLAVFDSSQRGAEPSGGQLVAIIFITFGSIAFFAVNAVLAIAALVTGRSVAGPLIGCALPFLVLAVGWHVISR